jgi:predicted ATPase/class 3 adenylate cyclase
VRRYGLGVAGMHAFLMTDLVGSTRATRADQVAMRAFMEQHDAVLTGAIAASSGTTFKHTGDGICAVFEDPADALRAAVESQQSLLGLGAAVRMGIDVGVAHERGDDYFGLTLNRCARVMGLAHGGQILVTLAVEELMRDSFPDGLALIDLGLVRLRDFGADDRLFQVVAPDLPRQFPALGAGRVLARFPIARTRLVGRVADLAHVAVLVGPGRLVSVVGTAGSGKTRLALEVLSERSELFGGGAFVDLSSIADPALVTAAVADAVDLPLLGPSPEHDLVAFLAKRTLLLVVDNCEHVVDSAAGVCDDLLSGCPGVALLTTAREPLKVPGEHVYRLGPLPIQDAAALFVERARRGGSTVAGEGDRPLIEDVCRRLDGIPLAIELAAAQAPRLPLPQLRALLDGSFGLLVDGGRRALPRHQTLEAALSWSYDLLPPEQQLLLRHLAVFSAPFALSGAECVAELEAETSAARELGSLVDKSLVVLDESSGGYRLLETVRSFAKSRLAESDETQIAFRTLHDRLLADAPGPWSCWLNMAPSHDPSFDVDNVRGVLEWCVAGGHSEEAAALVSARLSQWFVPGRAREALGWLTIPADLDESLSLDARLAWRTAATWLAFTDIDVDGISAIDRHLQMAPLDHPARGSLLFLKAWTLVWVDRDAFSKLLSSVRASRENDVYWQRQCDLLEGMALLLANRPVEAIDCLSWAVAPNDDTETRSARLFLAIAYHLADRHNDVTSIVTGIDRGDTPPSGFFSDLIIALVVVIEAVGRSDRTSARRALRELLDTTDRTYPHLTTASGFGVQAGAVVAHLVGRPEDAVTLLAGSRHHGLHRRYEGATALGRSYLKRTRALLTDDEVSFATQRGTAMTMPELVLLARQIAADESVGPPSLT